MSLTRTYSRSQTKNGLNDSSRLAAGNALKVQGSKTLPQTQQFNMPNLLVIHNEFRQNSGDSKSAQQYQTLAFVTADVNSGPTYLLTTQCRQHFEVWKSILTPCLQLLWQMLNSYCSTFPVHHYWYTASVASTIIPVVRKQRWQGNAN
jgi:hypothetical protein